ncbi:MAG: hypothetical protein EBY16_02950 [Gammaproteobacteria bacterium]|nr:hypothetical protein [Gammaproteobacteria bacterium]
MNRNIPEDSFEDDEEWQVSSLLKPRQKRHMDLETKNFFKSVRKVKKDHDFISEKKPRRRIEKRNESQ